MKVLIVSRPIINAGDFLFTKKAKEAFEVLRPDLEIYTGHTSDDFDLEYLNSFDGIVVAGGPIYDNKFLKKESFPLFRKIKDIKPKLYFMSNGWYGKTDDISEVFEYKLDQDVKETLQFIESKGGLFTCRDFLSETILKNVGLKNVKTIGCTAWYDYSFVDYLRVRNIENGIRKVVISDQGITKEPSLWEWKYNQVVQLVQHCKRKFPMAKFLFTFNGGINGKYSKPFNEKIASFLTDEGVEYIDISGSSDGFKVYDDANLHIGYRVHSHIYCMSKRIPSILIEEDARGGGTNEAMGLRQIRCYSYYSGQYGENAYMVKQLDYYIDDLIQSHFKMLEPAYTVMSSTFHDKFVPFVMSVGE